MRTAMNLPDVSIGEKEMQRGDLITVQGLGNPNAIIDVLIERSPRLKRNSPAARPIKNGSSVQVHFGTSRTAAKITLFDGPALGAAQSAIAQLRDRKSTRLNSSHLGISYAVFCLKKKNKSSIR